MLNESRLSCTSSSEWKMEITPHPTHTHTTACKVLSIHYHDVIAPPFHKYKWRCLLFNKPFCKCLWHPPKQHNMCEEMRVSGVSSAEWNVSLTTYILSHSCSSSTSGPWFWFQFHSLQRTTDRCVSLHVEHCYSSESPAHGPTLSLSFSI